jgi:DNA invertase Pin-like site-specific DNA recombinase
LVISIMGAVSQWEREAIGERTRDTLRHKRSNGERVGNIEFGYRLSADQRHLEPDPTEQSALAEVRNLRSQGSHASWNSGNPETVVGSVRAAALRGGWNRWPG